MRVVAVYTTLGAGRLEKQLRRHRGQDGLVLAGWERFIVDLWPRSGDGSSQGTGRGLTAQVRADPPSVDSVGPVARLIERKVDASYHTIVIATEEAAFADDDQNGPVRVRRGRIALESASDLQEPEVRISAYLAEPPPVESADDVPMETLGTWPITVDDRELRVWSLDGLPGEKTITLPKAKGGRYLVRVAVGYRSTRGLSLEDYAMEYYDRHGATPRGIERFVVDLWPGNS